MSTNKTFNVLTLNGQIVPMSSYNRWGDKWLWNLAWCHERYEWKRLGPEGRSWLGTVNDKGIQQLKDLGWNVEPAHIVLGVEDRDET